MALDPTPVADNHTWNYSRPNDPGFSTSLTGTVVAIQEVQAMNFGADGRPTTPKFWEDSGQPKMNIRIVLAGPSGGFRTLTFQPASRAAKEGKKPSLHMDLFRVAGGKSMLDLIGKTIRISTQSPPPGFSYGIGSPRPWKVELVTDQGPFQLAEPLPEIYLLPQVYANQAVSGGAVVPPQAPQAQYPQSGSQMTPAPPQDAFYQPTTPQQPQAPAVQAVPGQPISGIPAANGFVNDDDIPF